MFSWVVKVVPQPPDAPGTLGGEANNTNATAVKKATPPPPPPVVEVIPTPPPPKTKPVKKTEDDVASEDSQGQTGVLGWLSNGFVSALPQPTGSVRRRSGSGRSGENGERNDVMGWVTQGLNNLLPQPDAKYKEIEDETEHTEGRDVTMVYDVLTMPDYDPLPHIPVVEMLSEDDMSVIEQASPRPTVVNWIKQALPQPAVLPPGAVPIEPQVMSGRSSLDKVLTSPPGSLSAISIDADGKPPGMVGWLFSGLSLRMPQPTISITRDEPLTPTEVLQKGGKALRAP